jgi:hypothetical protein
MGRVQIGSPTIQVVYDISAEVIVIRNAKFSVPKQYKIGRRVRARNLSKSLLILVAKKVKRHSIEVEGGSPPPKPADKPKKKEMPAT